MVFLCSGGNCSDALHIRCIVVDSLPESLLEVHISSMPGGLCHTWRGHCAQPCPSGKSVIAFFICHSVRGGDCLCVAPQAVRASESALNQLSPSLEEASRTLGRTSLQTLIQVTLPLILPGLLAGGSLVFLTSLKELPATLLLRPAGFDTLAVRKRYIMQLSIGR